MFEGGLYKCLKAASSVGSRPVCVWLHVCVYEVCVCEREIKNVIKANL